jgi:hypothetical protein
VLVVQLAHSNLYTKGKSEHSTINDYNLNGQQKMKYKYFFTITAGRTGTAWLRYFLANNLKVPAVHEPLGIDDFGLRMPDIKLMRTFNTRGNDFNVKKFYKRKFDEIALKPAYAETNHTLAKSGLVENILHHEIAPNSCLIILRRNLIQQCVSYINRRDFSNITLIWQWYLHHEYSNNIVLYEKMSQFGALGIIIWYVFEMEARQRYYERLYRNRLNFVSVILEVISKEEGANEFLGQLGWSEPAVLPAPSNKNNFPPDEELFYRVQDVIGRLNFDVDSLVDAYIASGRTLCSTLT